MSPLGLIIHGQSAFWSEEYCFRTIQHTGRQAAMTAMLFIGDSMKGGSKIPRSQDLGLKYISMY